MLLRWAEGKEQSAWRREQSEKKKIGAQSSKSKDVESILQEKRNIFFDENT